MVKEVLNSLSKLKTFEEKINFLKKLLQDDKYKDLKKEIERLISDLEQANKIIPLIPQLKPTLETIKPKEIKLKNRLDLEETVRELHPEEVKEEKDIDYKVKDIYKEKKLKTYEEDTKKYKSKNYKKKDYK